MQTVKRSPRTKHAATILVIGSLIVAPAAMAAPAHQRGASHHTGTTQPRDHSGDHAVEPTPGDGGGTVPATPGGGASPNAPDPPPKQDTAITRPLESTTMPGGVSVSGLKAGSGAVEIREYVDMSSPASGQAHQRIVRQLLYQVAAYGLGSVLFRPLITSTDLNSTEAGCAVLSASRQNKAWDVAAALFRAQAAGGDWVNMGVLRRIGSHIRGLKVPLFLSDARGVANYSQLNRIRTEAKRAGVTVTPAFVVDGPNGMRVVQRPKSAAAVIDAIQSVQ